MLTRPANMIILICFSSSQIPRGGINRGPDSVWKIWYNPAIVPLFAPIVVAGGLCTWYMYRYFSANVEIAWSKEMRGKFDHTGFDDRRADKHSNRLLYPGIQERAKKSVRMFPFNFVPIHEIREARFIDYPEEEDE